MWSSLGCKRPLPGSNLIYWIRCLFTAQLTVLRDSSGNISCFFGGIFPLLFAGSFHFLEELKKKQPICPVFQKLKRSLLWFQEWPPNTVGHLCPEGALLKDVLHLHPSVWQQRGSVRWAVQEKHGVCCCRQGVWGKARPSCPPPLPLLQHLFHWRWSPTQPIAQKTRGDNIVQISGALQPLEPLTLSSVCVCLAQMSPRCASLALKHYLLKPVQRIPQYQLLLTGTDAPSRPVSAPRHKGRLHKDPEFRNSGNCLIESTWPRMLFQFCRYQVITVNT